MRGAREEIRTAEECRCPTGLGVCISPVQSVQSRPVLVRFGFALGFFASRFWMHSGTCHSPTRQTLVVKAASPVGLDALCVGRGKSPDKAGMQQAVVSLCV
jgi:hypothetical protein